MPEKPIPEQDPIVTKSFALHYLVAMVILMATLFWENKATWRLDFDGVRGVTPFRWRVRSLGLVVVSYAIFRS